MTLRTGEILWDLEGRSRPDCEGLGDYVKLGDGDWTGPSTAIGPDMTTREGTLPG